MKYDILFLGKTKDSFLTEGIDEYLKRLSHYTKVTIKTIKLKKMHGNEKIIKEKEGRTILDNVEPSSHLVALESSGTQFSSIGFASQIDRWEQSAVNRVTFVIGGPLGLSPDVLARAGQKISLSSMTFTHDMVRLFLLEQLYRAYTIKAGQKYHK